MISSFVVEVSCVPVGGVWVDCVCFSVSSVHFFHHAEDVDWFFVVFSVEVQVEWLWIVEPVFKGDVGVYFELVFGVVAVFTNF